MYLKKKRKRKKHNLPNLWEAMKPKLRGRCTAVNAYIKKDISQINNLTLNLKEGNNKD